MRARLFLLDLASGVHTFGGELDATTADELWERAEADPELVGRSLRPGDIVYIADMYLALDADGGWHLIPPGDATVRLHSMIR